MDSDLTLPNRIGFCLFRLAGTSKRALRVSSIFSHTIIDGFIGARNDVRASIADQGQLSTSVLVSDDIKSKASTEK